jgi:glycosyltransferase involved in cell wall biosynthesis
MRVALVDGELYDYRIPFLRALRAHVSDLVVLTPRCAFQHDDVPNRYPDLDITRLRSLSVRRAHPHPIGFREATALDFPYDLLLRLARFRPHVVISAEMGARTLQATGYRRTHPGSRLMVWARLSEHSEAARGVGRQRLRHLIVQNADALVTNGASGRKYLTLLGADPDDVHIVHQASAVGHPIDSYALHRPRRLLFVGRLIELKGLHLFLPVLSQFNDGSWTLTIAGDGPERPRLEGLCARLGLPAHFPGAVRRVDLGELYAEHDVFVFPSLKDEWGLVVNEALSAGLPVLGSVYSQAVVELVDHGRTGWIFRPNDPASVEQALRLALVASHARHATMSREARLSVAALTPERMADRFMSVIASLSAGAEELKTAIGAGCV